MKYWECVAMLLAVEHGLPKERYAEFETEARDGLRSLPLSQDEMNEEMKSDGEAVLSKGIELLKTDRHEFIRQTEEMMQSIRARN